MTTITRFFSAKLNAALHNPRWSWGAVDPLYGRVFLRIWKDQIETTAEGERVQINRERPEGRQSPGVAERVEHIDRLREGAAAYGVVCTAAQVDVDGARVIEAFDDELLLDLGDVQQQDGRTFARIIGRTRIAALADPFGAKPALPDDLAALIGSGDDGADSSEREALIQARVGQGVFRARVLKLWSDRCAVTGTALLQAVRASHIKPWRRAEGVQERLDPHNGLPLVASLDALFDAGLISFEDTGTMIASSLLSQQDKVLFGVEAGALRKKPAAAMMVYLRFHRERVFQL